MWLPQFGCPECGALIEEKAPGLMTCPPCGESFERRIGVSRFLSARRHAAAEPFIRQYRLVREREGYRVCTPEYYRMLPCVAAEDPHAREWALRRESYQHLQRWAVAGALRVLDLGAGNGWLSNRLAALGHRAVALDWLDDPEDGLGACRHYHTAFACVQADFDALPFAPGQFDLVVFNGSLHYSADVPATLARARLMLAPGGTLAVMDSPMFRDEADGQAMVADKLRQFKAQYGLRQIVHPNVGFLTYAGITDTFARIDLHGRFVPSRGSLAWRARRELARIRLRRAPAAFGVWIAS